MEYESLAYPGLTEPERPTISAHENERPEKPKAKRQKKSIDQQIAETEERLKKLKAKQRNEERTRRNHRLITSAATIEARAGHVELDQRIAEWLGDKLADELASDWTDLAQYVKERSKEAGR